MKRHKSGRSLNPSKMNFANIEVGISITCIAKLGWRNDEVIDALQSFSEQCPKEIVSSQLDKLVLAF